MQKLEKRVYMHTLLIKLHAIARVRFTLDFTGTSGHVTKKLRESRINLHIETPCMSMRSMKSRGAMRQYKFCVSAHAYAFDRLNII